MIQIYKEFSVSINIFLIFISSCSTWSYSKKLQVSQTFWSVFDFKSHFSQLCILKIIIKITISNDWIISTNFLILQTETVRQHKHKMHKNLQTFCKLVIQTYGQCWSENIVEFREDSFSSDSFISYRFRCVLCFSYCVRFNFSKLFLYVWIFLDILVRSISSVDYIKLSLFYINVYK